MALWSPNPAQWLTNRPYPAAQLVRLQLAVGGVLWFPNLAVPDPTLALPVLFAICNLCAIEVSLRLIFFSPQG